MQTLITTAVDSPSGKTSSALQNVFIHVTCVYKKDSLDQDDNITGLPEYPTGTAQIQFEAGSFDDLSTFNIQDLVDQAAIKAAKQI